MILMTIAAALAFASTAAPSGAAASQPATAVSAASAEPVLIPFKPPLGRPLRYRISRNGDKNASMVTRVAFARQGEGYRLTASFELPPSLPNDPSIALLRRPMIFTLASDGKITAIADEERWIAGSEELVRSLNKGKAAETRAMEAVIGRIRAMPAEARLELFARNHQPLTTFAATDMAPGETRGQDVASDTLLGPVEQQVTVTLKSVAEGRARFTMIQRLPAGQMAALFENIRSAVGPDLPQAPQGVTGERRSEFDVDVGTGLTTRFVSSVTINNAPGGTVSREIIRMEKLPS